MNEQRVSTRHLAAAITLAASAISAPLGASRAIAAESGDVARGAYLAKIMACNDCHTPWKMGAAGPEPDMSRMLSGHPQDLAMPAAPAVGAGPWGWAGAATNTAFAGPWGVSFTANLTPDPETGTGRWSERDFVQTIRTGRHLGRGREVLPPMPIPVYRQMTDADLKAIYAYLRTVPPVVNKVPEPRAPSAPMAGR